MLYLIGGTPRGGKSILARKLAQKLNLPYISTDNLRLVVMPYFERDQRNKSFPYEKMFRSVVKRPSSIAKFFQKFSGQQLLLADLKESQTIWPGINSLIKFLLECKMDYIIEGIHLLPRFLRKFKINQNIKIVFLGKINPEQIYKGLLRNKNNNDWIADNIKNKIDLLTAARAMSVYGKYFTKETIKYGFEFFNTEDDFNKEINNAKNYLIK